MTTATRAADEVLPELTESELIAFTVELDNAKAVRDKVAAIIDRHCLQPLRDAVDSAHLDLCMTVPVRDISMVYTDPAGITHIVLAPGRDFLCKESYNEVISRMSAAQP